MKTTDITSTKPKPYCFVLMPFSEKFDDVYNLGIQVSCSRAGAYCERVDEQIFQGTILERIYNQIAKADFIVADMTGRNPNVFYEVGYAHALNKPTILLTKDANDIPFDLKHYPHIVYDRGITGLIEELTRRARWFVENPQATSHAAQIEIELYLWQRNLSEPNVVHTVDIEEDCFLDIRIENASGKTLKPDDYGVGVITPATYRFRDARTTPLEEGTTLHMLPAIPILFSGSSASISCRFDGLPQPGGRDNFTFRIFTDAGKRDYSLGIARPSDAAARQRLLDRARSGAGDSYDAALGMLAETWPDADTQAFVRERAEEAPKASSRTSAMKILADKWPNEKSHVLLLARYREDPDTSCRARALHLLATKFPEDDTTSELLRAAVADAPTSDFRGLAFSLLGGLHSKFGRRLGTLNSYGVKPYADPLEAVTTSQIRKAAEAASLRPADIDKAFTELKAHLGWDPKVGLRAVKQELGGKSLAEPNE